MKSLFHFLFPRKARLIEELNAQLSRSQKKCAELKKAYTDSENERKELVVDNQALRESVERLEKRLPKRGKDGRFVARDE